MTCVATVSVCCALDLAFAFVLPRVIALRRLSLPCEVRLALFRPIANGPKPRFEGPRPAFQLVLGPTEHMTTLAHGRHGMWILDGCIASLQAQWFHVVISIVKRTPNSPSPSQP